MILGGRVFKYLLEIELSYHFVGNCFFCHFTETLQVQCPNSRGLWMIVAPVLIAWCERRPLGRSRAAQYFLPASGTRRLFLYCTCGGMVSTEIRKVTIDVRRTARFIDCCINFRSCFW